MHNRTTKNNIEILTLNFGFVDSPNFIKKSLWWFTKNSKNTEIMMVAAIDNNEIAKDIIDNISCYSAGISWKIIKTNTENLLKSYSIKSFGNSLSLSYKICDKLSSKRKIITSQQMIYPKDTFENFVISMEETKVKTINSYIMPKYVQEGLTDFSSNFSEYLARECRNYPINTKDYPPKNLDYSTKAFYENENDKDIEFIDGEVFYMDKDEIEQVEIKDENLEILIDETITKHSEIVERVW
jgi:hypothetical protein